MPPPTTSEKLTLTYPLFCANFISPKYLLVAGGGGEGRSGIGNKITLLDISETPQNIAEIDLSRSEDAVMSLAAVPLGSVVSGLDLEASSTEKPKPHRKPSVIDSASRPTLASPDSQDSTTLLFAGINSSESLLSSGTNKHFRTFSVSTGSNPSITHSQSLQLFTPAVGQHEIYQRLLRLSPSSSLVAIATGGASPAKPHAEIVIIDTTTLEPRERITPPSSLEVEDLDLHSINDVRERLAFTTSKVAYTHEISPVATKSSSKPTAIYSLPVSTKLGPKANLRAIRFLTPTILALVENAPARTGATVLLVNIAGKVLARKKLPKRVPAVTSMDVEAINVPSEGGTHQFAVAVAGADMSVNVLVANITGAHASLASHQAFRDVHPFQITQVAFGPEKDGKLPLASTSMGNTVVVHKFPLVRAKDDVVYLKVPGGKRQTIISVVISLFLVVVLAVLMQVVFLRRGLEITTSAVGRPEVLDVGHTQVVTVVSEEKKDGLETSTLVVDTAAVVVEVPEATVSVVPVKAEDGEQKTAQKDEL